MPCVGCGDDEGEEFCDPSRPRPKVSRIAPSPFCLSLEMAEMKSNGDDDEGGIK